jgi:hypothetical protein
MPNDWTPTTVRTRRDAGGTTYELELTTGTVRVRDHADGTIRLASATKGAAWTFERPDHGRLVPREHGYPVVRIRPEEPGR